MDPRSEHTFHIPVMGTAFTFDSPLRVARYGIGSAISIVDDHLAETLRLHYLRLDGREARPIPAGSDDARARRITAWLDYVDAKVAEQVEALRRSPFAPGSEIVRYFELLPEGEGKTLYRRMLAEADAERRAHLQEALRERVRAGRIEVNVMAKVDRDREGAHGSDASSAVRGFAQSTVRGALVLSAGFNPRLYGYLAGFDAFRTPHGESFEKEIVLKVSDYRSALVQGKVLAKRGLWVSEYRIESGINCGGHAFVTDGRALALVLRDFRDKRGELVRALLPLYAKALEALGEPPWAVPPPVRVTVQGGIGTAAEDRFLRAHYGVDGTGWGTPFLLVPEAVLVDEETLERLRAARPVDVRLGDGSPFGVPFWSLTNSAGEDERRRRLAEGRPGTSCPKGLLASNTQYGDTPLCTASRAYQRRERARLREAGGDAGATRAALEVLDARLCLCRDLAGTADRVTGREPKATPVVCAGPNLAGFDRVASLEEMIGHVYGRGSLLSGPRPHMLVRELELYADHLERERARAETGIGRRTEADLEGFSRNVAAGVAECRALAGAGTLELPDSDLARLDAIEARLAVPQARRAAG